MNNPKIIFILPNIYECVNGVSLKYINFIDFLKKSSYNFVLFTTFKDNESYNKITNTHHIKIIKTNGINIPFYKEIKIPILNKNILNNEITNGNEIIVFNGEFIWVYNILKKLKLKYNNIKLYPTMHTDYIFYNNFFYKKYNIELIFNFLNNYLDNKTFNGIIVTGEKMKEKYKIFTNAVFNANEVNLDIFNTHKVDEYSNNFYNIIYCGRISKEKNIDDFFNCCNQLKDIFQYNIHIIGDGPYLNNLKTIIQLEYKDIYSKITFYGNKNQEEINNIYQTLDNRVFLFTSISETFGKTPMEAGSTGIPIFIKKSEIIDLLYINKKNAFIFNENKDFLELFKYFIDLNIYDKKIFIDNSIENIKKYDQKIIFDNWIYFLLNGIDNKYNKNLKIGFFDILTFHGLSKLINCTGHVIGD